MHYPGHDVPVCRQCAGAPAHHMCGRCGAEDAPYARGLCARCVLHDRLTDLLGEPSARRERGLDGLFEMLLAARSPKDGIRTLINSPAIPVLGELARGEIPLIHETLDRLPARRSARWLEHLLVASGALPARDPVLARMEAWIDEHVAADAHEPVLRPFSHWIVLRRYRRKSMHVALNEGALNRAKAELRSATGFLEWLSTRDRPLEDCTQADVDAWLAGPRADRRIARRFARWAMAQNLMPRLDFPSGPRVGPTLPITQTDRIRLARNLIEDRQVATRDWVAAIFVAVYAQPISRVARFTIDDITITDTSTTIRFGETPVELPKPIANELHAWLTERAATIPPMVEHPRWLFPGRPPSRPIGELSLSKRLKRIGVDCKNDRRGALLHLAREMPAAILADLIGVHISTATAWAEIAGCPWSDYPSLRTPRMSLAESV
jgi:hypothetical protein